ncbi:hypothetical protein [Kribbella sp. CA-294648]|uniref:hypothetical protein n=1 Tax=Kribbella sp. CA-294648 TaxID=3239948 RepID=UPI003D91BC39
MKWLTQLRQATAPRRAATEACAACRTRDNTIAEQRAALVQLREELAEVRADAVSNLHNMFTLPLVEELAARGDQLGVDERHPDWVREYALSFMAECAGFEVGTRVLVAATRPGHSDRSRLPGTVREVWLDSDGEPTLFVAMDNPRDAARLLAESYDGPDGALASLHDASVLVPVPFPTTVRSIDAGGWIEAMS